MRDCYLAPACSGDASPTLPRLFVVEASSPDALGIVRKPANRIRRCHIPPTSSPRAVPNLQDGPEESRIARVTVLALARVAEGGRA